MINKSFKFFFVLVIFFISPIYTAQTTQKEVKKSSGFSWFSCLKNSSSDEEDSSSHKEDLKSEKCEKMLLTPVGSELLSKSLEEKYTSFLESQSFKDQQEYYRKKIGRYNRRRVRSKRNPMTRDEIEFYNDKIRRIRDRFQSIPFLHEALVKRENFCLLAMKELVVPQRDSIVKDSSVTFLKKQEHSDIYGDMFSSDSDDDLDECEPIEFVESVNETSFLESEGLSGKSSRLSSLDSSEPFGQFLEKSLNDSLNQLSRMVTLLTDLDFEMKSSKKLLTNEELKKLDEIKKEADEIFHLTEATDIKELLKFNKVSSIIHSISLSQKENKSLCYDSSSDNENETEKKLKRRALSAVATVGFWWAYALKKRASSLPNNGSLNPFNIGAKVSHEDIESQNNKIPLTKKEQIKNNIIKFWKQYKPTSYKDVAAILAIAATSLGIVF